MPRGPIADSAEHSIACLEPDGRLSRSGSAVLPLYSITKTFIAATVHVCSIDLAQPISRWFSPSWVPRGNHISVRQLLNHSSGLSDYFAPNTPYSRAVEAGHPPWDDLTYAEHTLHQPLLFEPGQGFAYSNPGYWLLGQILQKERDRALADAIDDCIARPLGLETLTMAHGLFADTLPDYPAEWVWHGLLLASANDVARFMASPLIEPLHAELTQVPGSHPPWRSPHYGHGVMVEPGERVGHNGGGPGYSTACFHFTQSGRTLCVLRQTSASGADGDVAQDDLLQLHQSDKPE